MPSENGLIPLYNNTRISRSLFCLNQEVQEEMDEEGNMISIFPKLIILKLLKKKKKSKKHAGRLCLLINRSKSETSHNFKVCLCKLYKKSNANSKGLDRNTHEVRSLVWKYAHVTLSLNK